MLLAVVGDVHNHFKNLELVLERLKQPPRVDAILQVGDVSNAPRRDSHTLTKEQAYRANVRAVLTRLRQFNVPVLWVPGNHDLPQHDDPGNIDGTSVMLDSIRFHGIGGATGNFGFAYEVTDELYRARPVIDCDVLLCHCPPANTLLDFTVFNSHVGSEAIRERAQNHAGLLLCGHIHEASGIDWVNRCLCVNVGSLGPPFECPQIVYLRLGGTPPIATDIVHENLQTGERQIWHGAGAI